MGVKRTATSCKPGSRKDALEREGIEEERQAGHHRRAEQVEVQENFHGQVERNAGREQ